VSQPEPWQISPGAHSAVLAQAAPHAAGAATLVPAMNASHSLG
jgi:hypothetical protein